MTLPVKKDQWNWEELKPKTKSQRREIYQKYGAKCFLRPENLGFPVCNIRGEIDCDGLRAAYVRARSLVTAALRANKPELAKEYEQIALKAVQLAKQYGCLWVHEEVHENDLEKLLLEKIMDFAGIIERLARKDKTVIKDLENTIIPEWQTLQKYGFTDKQVELFLEATTKIIENLKE